jgi:tRNA A-37 threonylcarbamoyl transferase component Bud32
MSVSLVATETITRVVGRGPDDLADAARRLAILRGIRHPGVCVPDEIGMSADGAVIATMPRIRGEDASVVARLRGGLSLGECVAIGIDIAGALTAMHACALAHGDVSPSNIVVSPTRSILVDMLSGARAGERGTVGFAAPERALGATPAGDVYSLGRVLEALVREDGRERMEAWVEPLCRPDPTARPSAEVASRALRGCTEPVPVSVPVVSVAAAVRARAVEPERTTTRLPSGRSWRVRRAVLVVACRSGIAVAGFLAFALVIRVVSSLLPQENWNYLPTIPMSISALATAPDEAALALLEARVGALASSNAEALLAVTDAGGSARAGDQPLADRLASGELRYDGLGIEDASSEVLSVEGNRATVRVLYQVPGYVVWDGSERVDVPTTSAVVDYDIAWSDGAWRVVASRPRP